VEQEQEHGDHQHDRSHEQGLSNWPFLGIRKEEHVHEDHDRNEEEHDPERDRDDPDRSVRAIEARLLACGRLAEPLVVGGLFARGLRLDALQRAEERDPNGLMLSPSVPSRMRSHSSPTTDLP
jgi:hypothetical protein